MQERQQWGESVGTEGCLWWELRGYVTFTVVFKTFKHLLCFLVMVAQPLKLCGFKGSQLADLHRLFVVFLTSELRRDLKPANKLQDRTAGGGGGRMGKVDWLPGPPTLPLPHCTPFLREP